MPTTTNGLPYPDNQDLLADSGVYVNNLRAALDTRLAKINYVTRTGQVGTDGNGFFTMPVTDFATLRGVVFLYVVANPADVWTIMPLITSIGGQALGGQIFYQDRGAVAAPDTRALANSTVTITYVAWGDPR